MCVCVCQWHLRYDLLHYMLQAVTFQSNIPTPLGRHCGKVLSSFCDSSVLQLQNVNTSKHFYHQIAVFIDNYNWNSTLFPPASGINHLEKGWTYVLQTTLKITHLIRSLSWPSPSDPNEKSFTDAVRNSPLDWTSSQNLRGKLWG